MMCAAFCVRSLTSMWDASWVKHDRNEPYSKLEGRQYKMFNIGGRDFKSYVGQRPDYRNFDKKE